MELLERGEAAFDEVALGVEAPFERMLEGERRLFGMTAAVFFGDPR